MPEAVIVDAIRTPIGRAMKGSLKTVRADELAAVPLTALQELELCAHWGIHEGHGRGAEVAERDADEITAVPAED